MLDPDADGNNSYGSTGLTIDKLIEGLPIRKMSVCCHGKRNWIAKLRITHDTFWERSSSEAPLARIVRGASEVQTRTSARGLTEHDYRSGNKTLCRGIQLVLLCVVEAY